MRSLGWLPPSVCFVLVSGLIGITTKVALRSLPLGQLFLWTAIAYAIAGAGALGTGAPVSLSMPGTALAIGTGGLAAAGLSVRFAALQRGEVSKVIPVTAAYPVVSVAIAAVALDEGIDLKRLTGTVLVVAGIGILGQP